MKLTAKTFAGLEGLLEKEISALGGQKVQAGRRVVEFEGDLPCLYRILYQSRYALTVLRPIWRFKAKDEHQAYRKAYSCDWSRYFDVDQTFSISPTVNSDLFTHSQYISLKIKDAICDRFRKNFNRRPSIDREYPDVKLDLFVRQDEFVISMDAAGEALFKRGYRRDGHQAPLNEVLAAGIIGLAEWNGEAFLSDGMCGTGTLCLEAALKKYQVPVQILRRNWACMKWKDYDHGVWKAMEAEAKSKMTTPDSATIFGSDLLRSAVFTADRSANLLEIHDACQFTKKNFFQLEPPSENGVLIMNPPYGERMGDEVEELYERIGDRLKHHWQGHTVFLFTGNIDAAKRVGLRTARKIPLFNGPIECRLLRYEMW